MRRQAKKEKSRTGELRSKKTERNLRDKSGGVRRERKMNGDEGVNVIKLWKNLNCSPGPVEVSSSSVYLGWGVTPFF